MIKVKNSSINIDFLQMKEKENEKRLFSKERKNMFHIPTNFRKR